MLNKHFKIIDQQGLQAKAATQLVKSANSYFCDLKLTLKHATVDLKSIMGVLSLGAFCGEEFTITANGSDEDKAMQAIWFQIMELKLAKEI